MSGVTLRGVSESDWPRFAKIIISDIAEDKEITSSIILEHFDLKPSVGLIKRVTSFFKSIFILIVSIVSLNGCFSPRLQVESLTKNYAVLNFDYGAMIPPVDEDIRLQKIKEACPSGKYEIIDKETKTVGQYRFRTKILFRCIEVQ